MVIFQIKMIDAAFMTVVFEPVLVAPIRLIAYLVFIQVAENIAVFQNRITYRLAFVQAVLSPFQISLRIACRKTGYSQTTKVE